MKLTSKLVEKLRQMPGRHHAGDGLYLQVRSEVDCSWLFRYQHRGRERQMGLGSIRDFTLAEARESARKARQMLYLGDDPIEVRRAEKAARALEAARTITFQEAVPRSGCAREPPTRRTTCPFECVG